MTNYRKNSRRHTHPIAPDEMGSLSGRLLAYRNNCGLTQQDVAEIVGISRTQICKYESDLSSVPDHILNRLADLYRVHAPLLRYGLPEGGYADVVGIILNKKIQAGRDRNLDIARVEVPASWIDAHALLVSDSSYWPVVDAGTFVIYRGDTRLSPAEFLNKQCLVNTADGREFIARVRQASAKHLVCLELPNDPTIVDVEIVSAMPIVMALIP